jgi:signal transduction histidine kinase
VSITSPPDGQIAPGRSAGGDVHISRPRTRPTDLVRSQLGRGHRLPVGERVKLILARPMVGDALIASVLATVSLVGLVARLDLDLLEGDSDIFRPLDALGVGLVLLQTAPLVFRRRAPVWILAVTLAALVVFSLLHYHPSLAAFGFILALYTVSTHRDRRVSIPAGIASGVGVLVILLIGRQPVAPDTIAANYLIVGAAWFLGEGVRLRRRHVVRLEDRATRLEREREEQAQLAVAQERRVIARELHDVVAHNVSVIVAQAGAAQGIFNTHPQEALAALGAIEHSGREALVEMRLLMGFLRTEDDHSVPLSPQPGLRNLDALITQVRDAGVPVTLRVEGYPRPLPAALDLSAFRIIQEALTNVLKHASPARAEVLVRYGESCLELSVENDGVAKDVEIKGQARSYGQLGMQERVALFGGELRLGGGADGEYQVKASLPLQGNPS